MVLVTVMDGEASVTSQFQHLAALQRCTRPTASWMSELMLASLEPPSGMLGIQVRLSPLSRSTTTSSGLRRLRRPTRKWWVYRAALGRDAGDRPMNVMVGTGSSFWSEPVCNAMLARVALCLY